MFKASRRVSLEDMERGIARGRRFDRKATALPGMSLLT
jgi:hypothetical protein